MATTSHHVWIVYPLPSCTTDLMSWQKTEAFAVKRIAGCNVAFLFSMDALLEQTQRTMDKSKLLIPTRMNFQADNGNASALPGR